MGMENQRYMQEGLDGKRFLLLLAGKLWLAAAGAAAGALAGGGVYLLVHFVFAAEREFQTVSKIYLHFNCEPEDFSELSYNGYTWNDLMATDPILDYTMEMLPAGTDRNEVIAATKAEILSDIRLLTVTVTAAEPELAAQIMEATQKSLVHLGEADELFDSIEIYSTEAPQQILWDDRTANAAAAGAALGGLAVCMALAFWYVLEDSVYVAEDLEKRYGIPVFGLLVKGDADGMQRYGKEFAVNYRYLCRDADRVVLAGVEDGMDWERIRSAIREAAETIGEEKNGENGGEAEWAGRGGKKAGRPELEIGGNLEAETESYRRIREADGVILCIGYGAGNGKRLERALGNLKKQDCRVLGAVIAEADGKFLKLYYSGRQSRRRDRRGSTKAVKYSS